MPVEVISSPPDLVARIIQLFPSFAVEWNGGEAYGYENGDFSYHSVFLTFAPLSYGLLMQASSETVRSFCDFVNAAVEQRGTLENAVSTCFLEHASHLAVRRLIEPSLSAAATRELR